MDEQEQYMVYVSRDGKAVFEVLSVTKYLHNKQAEVVIRLKTGPMTTIVPLRDLWINARVST